MHIICEVLFTAMWGFPLQFALKFTGQPSRDLHGYSCTGKLIESLQNPSVHQKSPEVFRSRQAGLVSLQPPFKELRSTFLEPTDAILEARDIELSLSQWATRGNEGRRPVALSPILVGQSPIELCEVVGGVNAS